MRVVGTIPHSKMSITLFHMNDKFILKFEAGPMEQVYKFPQQDIAGIEGVKEKLTDDFLNAVIERFNQMYLAMKQLK